MKTKLLQKFALPIIFGLLTMYGCTEKNYYDPNYTGGQKEKPLDLDVPADMNWNMLSTTRITVNVDDDEYSNDYYYKVEILSGNPFEGETYKTLAIGIAKKGKPYTANIDYIKSEQNTFYIRKTSPVGRVSVQPYSIEIETPVTRSASAPKMNYQAETRAASSVDYDPTGAIELTSGTVLQSGKKYIISNHLKEKLKIYSLNSGNATIFIKGEYTTLGQNLQNINLVVLNGGKINGKVIIADKASLAILPGGKADVDQMEAQQNGNIQNYGEINAKEFILNNKESTVFNNAGGELKGTVLKFTGGALQNDGTINFNMFSPNGGNGIFTNNCQAFFNECVMSGSIKVILNKGIIAKDYKDGKYIPIENFCCEGNCTINMNGGSMIKATDATMKGSGTIISDGKHNLLKVINTLHLSDNSTIKGELAIECPHLDSKDITHPNGVVEYEPGKSQVIISSCGGEEIPDVNPTPPRDPDFPIEVVTSSDYIFAMEDQWPTYGDYDMNDLVIGISPDISNYINPKVQTKVKQVKFEIRILAVGALKQIAAAIQLDNITPEQIESVEYRSKSRQELLGGNCFPINKIGVEMGQEKAVIPLFENANKLLGNNFTNVGRDKNVNPIEFDIVVDFKNNADVKPEDLSYKALNFFIIPDLVKLQTKQRRPEIHLGGYAPTSLANPDLFDKDNVNARKYIGKDNLVWGLIIPTREWKCPDEGVSIIKRYEHFKEWVTSGGKLQPNWYK